MAVDMHALAVQRRAVDPDLKFAHEKRLERAKLRSETAKMRAANEALKLDLEAARLELASRPARADGDMAGLPELAGLWSSLVRDEGAKVGDRLEASRLLADALGITKGGARDTGAATAEAVSAVVLESAAIAARAAERDRLRARLAASGLPPEVIAGIIENPNENADSEA